MVLVEYRHSIKTQNLQKDTLLKNKYLNSEKKNGLLLL